MCIPIFPGSSGFSDHPDFFSGYLLFPLFSRALSARRLLPRFPGSPGRISAPASPISPFSLFSPCIGP